MHTHIHNRMKFYSLSVGIGSFGMAGPTEQEESQNVKKLSLITVLMRQLKKDSSKTCFVKAYMYFDGKGEK